jgi:transposase-like protein
MPTLLGRPRSPFNRPRWTADDARKVVAALERSGQSVTTFASEHGLDAQRVYLWRRRLGKAEPTTFQELAVRPAPVPVEDMSADAPFEIVLASGHVLRVPSSFDTRTLARLIDVLGKAGMC